MRTSIKVVEYDADGTPLEAVNLTIRGEMIYCDAVAVKFPPRPDKSAQRDVICIFHRIFTDRAAPAEGYQLFHLEGHGVPSRLVWKKCPMDIQEQVWTRLRRMMTEPDFATSWGAETIRAEPIPIVLGKDSMYEVRMTDEARLVVEERNLGDGRRNGAEAAP